MVTSLGVAFITLSGVGRAEITESKDDLLSPSRSGFVSWAKEHGAPAGPLGKSDRLVLVQAGAAFADVLIIGPVGSDVVADARTLQGLLPATADIEYGEEEEGMVLVATLANNRIFRSQSRMVVPAGAIVRAMQEKGLRVLSFARARRYATVSGLKQIDETRRWRYFSIDADSNPTFAAHLAGPELWGPPVMLFGPLMCLLMGFGAATLYAGRTNVAVERRRAVYKKLALWPVFGSIAICLPLSLWLIVGGHLYTLVDLWFGSASVSPMILLMMPTLMVPLIALGPMNKVEGRLFGPSPDEPLPPVTEESKEVGKGLSRWAILIGVGVLALWAISVQLVPREYRWITQVLYILAIASVFLRSALVDFLLKLKRTSLLDADPGDPILQEVSDVAGQVGVRIRKLTIVEPGVVSADPACASFQGEVTINRPFLELPEGERRFGLALALGRSPAGSVVKMMVVALPLAGGFALLMAFGPSWVKSLGPLLLIAPMALFLPILIWWTPRSLQQDIRRSTMRALTVCNDVEAARRFMARSLEGEAFNGAGLSVRAHRRRTEFVELFQAVVAEYEANVHSA